MNATPSFFQLCLLLSLLSLFCFSRGDEYQQGYSGCKGRRWWCSYKRAEVVSYKHATTVKVKIHYRVACGLWGWGRCSRTRYEDRTSYQRRWRTEYRMECRRCNIDCRVNAWTQWQCDSPCCGVLRQTRTRSVQVPRSGSGNPCPSCSQSRTIYDDTKACYIGGRCYSNGQTIANGCQRCNKDLSRTSWQRLTGTACNDGDACTANDRCQSGVCRGRRLSCKDCQTCDGAKCSIRSNKCLIGGTCYSRNDRNPASSQCQACDPSKTAYDRFYFSSGSTCNDGNACTKNDNCTASGRCVGIPYTCLRDCQTCTGNGGCRLTKGCLTSSGKCGCQINGRCYAHDDKNPDQDCQRCDIHVNAHAWTGVADGTECTDNNTCTRRDQCRNAICQGQAFTCAVNPQQKCLSSSHCNGENCSMVYQPSNYRCYRSRDACDWPDQFCSGQTTTCLRNGVKPIEANEKMSEGVVSVLHIDDSSILPLVVFERETAYLLITQNHTIRALFSNFTVPCGEVTFTWQIIKEDNNGTRTSISDIKTARSGVGGTVEVSWDSLKLENGGLYRVIVSASNARNDVTDAESELILVDTTPPLFSGMIRDGNPSLLEDADYQTNTTYLSAYWNPDSFQDAESGVDLSTFTVAAGLSPYLTDVSEPVVADANRGVITGLTLEHDTSYYVTVSVANRAGLRATAVSNGILVDTTPPYSGVVTMIDGSENSLHFVSVCKRRITAKIVNFKDEESGLADFQWKLCNKVTNLTSTVVHCTEQGFATFPCSPDNDCTLDVEHPDDGLVKSGCLMQSFQYQLHVRVWNNAGAFTYTLSNIFIIMKLG